MSIIMTGGGTGGHLTIIKAVKEQLGDKKLIYVGSTSGQDIQWFQEDKDFQKKYFFNTQGVVNQSKLGKIKSFWMLSIAILKSMWILHKHKAKVVFSVGGFSAAPMAIASKLSFVPLVIHEQNASIGTLNRLLKPYALAFISSYLEESPIHAYPIKEIFFENAYERKEIKTVIFLGGSQGATAINSLALFLAPFLKEKGIKIIHQAGEKNIDFIQKEYEKLAIEAEVFGFTNQLASKMKVSDFAIARAGASTLWELSASGIPALYIPYPYALGDHQFYNAEFLVKKNLAWVMRESEIDKEKIKRLFDENLTFKSRGLIELVEKKGSKAIAKFLTQI